jgi:hypothetical protein
MESRRISVLYLLVAILAVARAMALNLGYGAKTFSAAALPTSVRLDSIVRVHVAYTD